MRRQVHIYALQHSAAVKLQHSHSDFQQTKISIEKESEKEHNSSQSDHYRIYSIIAYSVISITRKKEMQLWNMCNLAYSGSTSTKIMVTQDISLDKPI